MKHANTVLLIAIMIVVSQPAWTQVTQGTTHDDPLDDATVVHYLKDYFGLRKCRVNGTDEWHYTATRTGGSKTGYTYHLTDQPSATQPGDAILVEVNDRWKGTNWKVNTSVYDQVKYGIKKIHDVTQSTLIGNGEVYHCDVTTNRMFFAVRTSDFYYNPENNITATWQPTSNDDLFYYKETYKKPMRWYNEVSPCMNTAVEGWDQLEAQYDDLKDGDFLPAPHSCSNSLEKNHFALLYDKETVGQTYSVSIMLFVPTGANATSNSKNGNFASGSVPQVFFYINQLAAERVEKQHGTPGTCKYDAVLNWKTSIDKALENGIDFVPWNNKVGGMKEESHIYRKIEGEDSFQEIWVENGLVNLKTWTDTTLPEPKEDGYDVTYYVITKAVTYDAAGNRLGQEIATAVTNQVKLHIPGGTQYFELAIANGYNSRFVPEPHHIGLSYNLITNDIKAAPTEFTPSLDDLHAGDRMQLLRYETNINQLALNTLEVTGISGGEYSYTLNGTPGTARWTSMQDVLNLAATYRDEVRSIPGRQFDARYQLVFTSGGEDFFSNIVTSSGKRTDVSVADAYRSGTPDPVKNAPEELYSVNVRFRPVMSDDIAHYYIWANGEERVARIGQSATSYTLVGKDANGDFNVNLGEVVPDEDGYLAVHVDYSLDKHVCVYEEGSGRALDRNDLFFTVEVCTTGGNTYGNYDCATSFVGIASELVVNSDGTFYKGNATRPGEFCAEITWDKIKDKTNLDEGDYVAGEPDYYTVYRWNTNTDEEVNYVPITQFIKGHNDVYDDDGNLIERGNYVLVDKTTDGSPYKFTPQLIKEVEDDPEARGFKVVDFFSDLSFVPASDNDFPAVYYVKAHYETPFKAIPATFDAKGNSNLRNYIEKNSNPTRAASVIVTGVRDVVKSEIVGATYYTLQGTKVVNPARGQIVVVQYRMSDGSTTARIVKF